jgi:hypothetical protein
LDKTAESLVDETPTCGAGLAQHAPIPAQTAEMFAGLAETLELHRTMLKLDDPHARKEDEVYGGLANDWREIARLVDRAAKQMAAQRELPMGAHDERAWGDQHLRAFEKFVNAQTRLLALLQVAAKRDEQMLASMTK